MHTIDCSSWTQGNRSHIFIDFINLIIFMRSISRFSICFLDSDLVEIKALWDSVTLHTLKLKAWKDHLLLGNPPYRQYIQMLPKIQRFLIKTNCMLSGQSQYFQKRPHQSREMSYFPSNILSESVCCTATSPAKWSSSFQGAVLSIRPILNISVLLK